MLKVETEEIDQVRVSMEALFLKSVGAPSGPKGFGSNSGLDNQHAAHPAVHSVRMVEFLGEMP